MHVDLDNIPNLEKVHVSIDLKFLQKLCRKVSGCSQPSKDVNFVKQLGMIWNKQAQKCTTIEGWLRGYRTVPMSKLAILCNLSGYAWKDVEKHITAIKAGQHNGEIQPNFPILFDEKLGCIAGHILGDGAILKPYAQVFYSNKNSELLNEFIQNMRQVLGAEPRIWQHANNKYGHTKWQKRLISLDQRTQHLCIGLFYPKICGLVLHGILGRFAFGRKKLITSQILSMPEKFKKGFLRALFDDEGSCNAKSYMIRMHQDDRYFLENLRTMLFEFNIETNPVRVYHKRGKPRYYFNITKNSNFISFAKNIGFTSERKQEQLDKLVKGKIQRRLVTPTLLHCL